MKNGVYRVGILTPLGEGRGIITVENGRVTGGDDGYFFVGSIQDSGGRLSGSVRVRRHDQSSESLFGDLNDFVLNYEGTLNGDNGALRLVLPGSPMEGTAGLTLLHAL